MRAFEWGELGLICLGSGALWLSTPELSWTISYGTVLCYAAGLILGQGLIRDLALIVKRRVKGEAKTEGARLKCLCAESSLGLLVIVLGCAMLFLGIEKSVSFHQWGLTGTAFGIMVLGFLIKDYVVIVRKEKDHQNLIIW